MHHWVLMPVLNEAKGLPGWMRLIGSALNNEDTTFVISDDGSTDGISETLIGQANFPKYVLLGDGINRGPGAAFAKGFEYIFQHGSAGDAVITLESDGTADVSSLKPMLEALNANDVALASVYLPGGGFTRTDWGRLMLSNAANTFTRFALNLPYRTLTSFYRAYRFEALQKLSVQFPKIIEESGFTCQVELLYKCRIANLSITEIVTKVFSDRRIGSSKMKVVRTIREHLRFVFKTRFKR